MSYAASCSTAPDLSAAVDSICEEVAAQLNGTSPDLSLLFVSHAHADHFEELASLVRKKSNTRVLLGCTGETVVGGGQEIEDGPVVSLWSAILPGTGIEPFYIQFSETPDGILSCGFPPAPAPGKEDARAVLLLGEPFSSVPKSMIERFGEEFPGVPLIGGMASGASGPGRNRLFLNSECHAFGAVGVVLHGGPRIRSVVSQGCRPIGTHYVITKAEGNVVYQLGGAPPMQRLHELLSTLSEQEQQLMEEGLHLGVVMNEYQDTFRRGDFLIANLLGADAESGAIAIGSPVRTGQTVQFHVRDAQAADEDLHQLLDDDRTRNGDRPQAALLFSCNGRGTRLFPEANHDAGTIQSKVGPIPLAGFFAQGEFGPVGGKNHIHGFTASVALFE